MIFKWITAVALLFLFVSAPAAYMSVCRNRRPESFILSGLLINGLLFYIFAAFGHPKGGFQFICCANLLLWFPVIKKSGSNLQLLKRYFTPSVTAFWAVVAGAFIFSAGERFLTWDEFSHWGFAARMLFERNALNCAFGEFMSHCSYPPGAPLLEVMIHRTVDGVVFREWLIVFAVCLLQSAMLLSLFALRSKDDGATWRNGFYKSAVIFCSGLILLGIFCHYTYFCVYVDALLGVCAGTLFFRIFSGRKELWDDIDIALLLSWLCLFKKAGLMLAVFGIVLFLIREIKSLQRRKTIWAKIRILLVPAFALAVNCSWGILLKLHNTPIQFSAKKFSFAAFGRFLRYGEPDYSGQVALEMVKRFFCGSWVLPLSVVMLAGLFICYHRLVKNKTAAAGGMVIFSTLFLSISILSLFFTYIFVFYKWQALKAVSFERYVFVFILALLIMVFMQIAANIDLPEFRLRTVVILAAVVALFAFAAKIERRLYEGDGARRRALDRIVARYQNMLRVEGKRFIVFSVNGGGQMSYMLQYEFPDTFERLEMSDPVLNVENRRFGETETSVNELKKLIAKYDYVLIDEENERFFKDYAEIFHPDSGRVAEQALYRVEKDGKLHFVPHSVPAE